jgi:hypothetical protein
MVPTDSRADSALPPLGPITLGQPWNEPKADVLQKLFGRRKLASLHSKGQITKPSRQRSRRFDAVNRCHVSCRYLFNLRSLLRRQADIS